MSAIHPNPPHESPMSTKPASTPIGDQLREFADEIDREQWGRVEISIRPHKEPFEYRHERYYFNRSPHLPGITVTLNVADPCFHPRAKPKPTPIYEPPQILFTLDGGRAYCVNRHDALPPLTPHSDLITKTFGASHKRTTVAACPTLEAAQAAHRLLSL